MLANDLAENNAQYWLVTASDNAPSTLSDDTNRVRVGQASLRLETQSGFDVTMAYSDPSGPWDLSGPSAIEVSFYANNPSPVGFQERSPWFLLVTDTGTVRLRAEDVPTDILNDARGQWIDLFIPLAGNSTWTRTDTGTPDLSAVTRLEVHSDTWDSGFTLWMDGLSFVPLPDPLADLSVIDATAPASGTTGQTVSVSWVVENTGGHTRGRDGTDGWFDQVYLSADLVLDESDLLAGSHWTGESAPQGGYLPAPLGSGRRYTISRDIVVPDGAEGANYLLFVTDRSNLQGESNENNNVRAVPFNVALDARPDLTIVSANVPTTLTAGQDFTLYWTVSNVGTASANEVWYDSVYFSTDAVFDPNDEYLTDWYVNRQPRLAPGESYTLTDEVYLDVPGGSGYLLFITADGQVRESDLTNNVLAVPVTVTAPELVVTNFTAPSNWVIGTSTTVSWAVQNQGTVAAANNWYDYFFLSTDNVLSADDRQVTSIWMGDRTPLSAGASYSSSLSLALPSVAAGDYFLIISADHNNSQPEASNEVNTRAAPVHVTGADLVVTAFSGPAQAIAGGPLSLSWTVTNQGEVTLDANSNYWEDHFYFSTDATLDGTDILLDSYYYYPQRTLAPGTSYTAQREGVISDGAPAGTGYIIVLTQSGQRETDTTNNSRAIPITFEAPDLTVSSATAPAQVNTGAVFFTTWTVDNVGNVPAHVRATDTVYLSSDPIYDSSDRNLGSFTDSIIRPLPVEGTYTQSQSLTIPTSVVTGDYYLLFVSNTNRVQGETDETNNLLARPIRVIGASGGTPGSVDLLVTQASGPASALLGEGVEVSWTVKNQGQGDTTTNWYDYVYFSTDATYDDADRYLYGTYNSGQPTLAAGSTYTRNAQVRIPADLPAGGGYLLIVTDRFGYQPESDEGNNTRAVAIGLVTPTEQNTPDLTVTALGGPAVITLWETSRLDWHVQNVGMSATRGTWADQVYLSTDPYFDYSDVVVGSWDGPAPLAAGAGYVREMEIYPRPDGESDFRRPGTYYLLIRTDADDAEVEWNEANNVYAIPVLVQPGNGPDLIPTNLVAPAEASFDTEIEVTWTVQNTGGIAIDSTWYDSFYLSDDPVFSPDDEQQDDFYISGNLPLEPGESYTLTTSLYLWSDGGVPNGGDMYLLIVADDYGYQWESNESNNVRAIPIHMNVPDFVVEATAPQTGRAGEYIDVSWTVTNDSDNDIDDYWYDYVYLSTDPFLDGDDEDLWSDYDNHVLASGASYTIDTSVYLPTGLAGNFYLLFVTDRWDYVPEGDETNNLVALPITLAASTDVDLVVSNYTAPEQGVVGQTVNLTWEVTNLGDVNGTSYFYDTIYLSRDPIYDSSDTYLTDRYNDPLAAGAIRTNSYNFTLPSSGPGAWYILVYTDRYDYQNERDEANNVRAIPINIFGPDLVASGDPGPISATPGGSVTVTWTTTNVGNTSANADWYDVVYYSHDAILDSNDTVLYREWQASRTPLPVDASYTTSRAVTVPVSAAGGTRYLLVKTDSYWSDTNYQNETNEANNVYALEVTVSAPDLVVTNLAAPSSAVVGGPLTFSWTVKNDSTLNTLASNWYDYVYLSSDPIFDSSDQQILQEFIDTPAPLAAGNEYTITKTLTVPTTPAGQRYLIVVSDRNVAQGESNEANNVAVVPLQLTAPDLIVTNFVAPASADVGEEIEVTWTVKNVGDATATADWTDRISLPSWGTVADIPTGDQPPLAPGESYTLTRLVRLLSSPSAGNTTLEVRADISNNQPENDDSNNSLRRTIQLRTPADLVVTEIIAPAEIAPNQQFTLTWTVKNIGTATASGDWSDSIRINYNNSTTFFGSKSITAETPLAPGESYTVSGTFTMPSFIPGGTWNLSVFADSSGNQGESNNNNNGLSVPVVITTADLTVTSATAPTSASPGQSISVSWTVKNQGATPANANWVDRVYLSSNNTLSGDDILVDAETINAQTPLAAGASYTISKNITIPLSATGGARFLLFVTDSSGNQIESNENNNVRSVAITIGAPDLIVSASTSPTQGILNGTIDVSWTVKNQGTTSADADWTDRVYLSRDNILDGNDSLLVSVGVTTQTPLAANATYTLSQTVTIPDVGTGSFFVMFVPDYFQNQGETNEANNVKAVAITLTAPDLIVPSATAPANAILGQPIDVSWTVRNAGTVAAPADWSDRVYYSNDAFFDPSDTLIHTESAAANTPLVAGAEYTLSKTITLPATTGGTKYLLFVADALGQQGETNESNNYLARAITVGAPDLTVSASTSPTEGVLGHDITVSWTVTNAGDQIVFADFHDRVYISTDSVFDVSDVLFIDESITTQTPLDPDASYTVTRTRTLPQAPIGDVYLLFVTDTQNQQGETDETNNLRAVPIRLRAADLQVSSVTAPGNGQPGEKVTLSWVVTNQGDGPARANWVDRVYLSPTGLLVDATHIGSVTHTTNLANGDSYSVSAEVTLPDMADGDYFVLVVTDQNNNVPEGPAEGNNQATAVNRLLLRHADLRPTIVQAPTSVYSGTDVTLKWDVKNEGTAATLGGWADRIYLSTNATLSGDDRLLGEYAFSSVLPAGSTARGERSVRIPVDVSGDFFLLVVSDATNKVRELSSGENNNLVSSALHVELAPYADLAVTSVTAPQQLIGDPARLTVSWVVKNQGTGVGYVTDWVDRVIVSTDTVLGNSDDRVLGSFAHTGGLAVNGTYPRTETIILPAGFTGRYHLFGKTDADNVVFENGSEANNTTESATTIDIMPLPYSDLVISTVTAPTPVYSGRPLTVTWTVTNQGIGTTSTGTWIDKVYIARNPDGTDRLPGEVQFQHFGHLGVGGSYTRSGEVFLPNGLEGTFYAVVVTGGPFEFIYTTNNTTVSSSIVVTVPSLPDLVVTEILAPATAEEGTLVDLTWTLTNAGASPAEGSWVDRVYLQKAGDTSAPLIELGQYRYTGPVGHGNSYTRTEAVRLPVQTNELYRVFITTDYKAEVYEGTTGEANNTTRRDTPIAVSAKPRPDLQVNTINVPDEVPAGASLSVQFTVINQGTVATPSRWVDRVYLSLDPTIDQNDILIGEIGNQAALAPGEEYASSAGPIRVPKRFRENVYVIVRTDAAGVVEEWPNEGNNTVYQQIYIEPLPLSDLVVSEVVAPNQVVAGSQVEVRYTVTNLGAGETDTTAWTETIWLTTNKDRPNPAHGDILLKSYPYSRSDPLGRNAGYDQVVNVKIPTHIASGTWYITPWVDPYDVELEDTLASNTNPDDPNQIDNNNYKAREVTVIGALPDLVVTSVQAPTLAEGGDTVTISWTVENRGTADALPGNWGDRVYLSDNPDPKAEGARSLFLGQVRRETPLAVDASYSASLTVQLSPSAKGMYFVVIADDVPATAPAPNISLPGFSAPSTERPFVQVIEANENNNARALTTDVRAVPANLKVTNIEIPAENYSGEEITIRYTVTNLGPFAVWEGTRYWKDFLWLSADPTFIRERASYLGEVVTTRPGPLNPGESYDVEFTTKLPEGTDGPYYLYIHLDAHNDYSPVLFPYLARRLLTDWWSADTGSNAGWLEHHQRWAFEDPTDNLARADVPIIYREPDLVVTDLELPTSATSGQTVQVTYTVTNEGNRTTRTGGWTDRIFISRDPSLDNNDHTLTAVGIGITGGLEAGDSYTRTVDVRLPDDIEGTFYLLVYTDAAAFPDPLGRLSDIGFNLIAVEFERLSPLAPWDLASQASRELARGRVKEYQGEGNNITSGAVPITLAPTPDLQVSVVTTPDRAYVGQQVDVTWTVTNAGGVIPGDQQKWEDLIYLSRDPFLDFQADRYIAAFEHTGGLAVGDSYSSTKRISLPTDLIGAYYVFVVTDPARNTPRGKVFEGSKERNNSTPTDEPLVIELPPPSDLVVTSITVPENAIPGESVSVTWTVTNTSDQVASGRWSDSLFFSTDATWGISDRAMGKVEFTGTLQPGQSYTRTLNTILPSLTPGQYRVIVRADIFNEVYENVADANNTTASADIVNVMARPLELGVPLATTLSTGQERLYQVTVPLGRTLKVTLIADNDKSASELFIRHLASPTGTVFDAASRGKLSAEQVAVIPATEAGVYYILVRGFAMPQSNTPVTVLAELVPLAITNVHTDKAGASRYVTTTIEGAQFHPDAIVKLVRPGIAEYEPINYEVLNATTIRAVFDLTDAPHGLYDLKVINPGNEEAIAPYRFLIERVIEPETTIGIGGPRYILAGDSGTYSVALQNLGNVDAPYVYYNVGIPEMGINEFVYNLPYVRFFSNLRGSPDGADLEDVPWAELNSAVNTDGNIRASGYAIDLPADGFTGFTFDVTTYAGLRELYDRAWEELKAKLYKAFPKFAEQDILADGPTALDRIYPGLYTIWSLFGSVPDLFTIPFVPFQFHLFASATAMTRDEFITHALGEADKLRAGILADPDASASLLTLAADKETWNLLFLASLEEAGLLRPEGEAPPIRRDPKLFSVMSTLATGILAGPAGEEILTTDNLTEFFNNVRKWYGHDEELEAPIDPDAESFTSDSLSLFGLLRNVNGVPEMPTFADYDLGLTYATHFEAFRVYSPWVPWEKRSSGIPADYQIRGVIPDNTTPFFPFNLEGYYSQSGADSGAASISGPFTVESNGFIPIAEELPFTINFQNDPASSTYTSEIRVVTPLDEHFEAGSFRLGDIKIGDITIHIPEGRSLFQGEFDFTQALGFVLRVSAGVDLVSRSATWLLQAIDPLTGELIRDPSRGLLRPNNAQGQGAGFVSFSIVPMEGTVTGTEVKASARVLFNNAPPEDTPTLTYLVDGVAPVSTLTVTDLGSADFRVAWDVTDEVGGSEFKHVTLYVSEDGRDFVIWKRQLEEAQGAEVYVGRVGHTYQFLALATDIAGNREVAPAGRKAQDDGSRPNLGSLPSAGPTTPPNFGQAPAPTTDPSTNDLFTQAEQGVPAGAPTSMPSEYDTVLAPFQARSFTTGIAQSHANIGPMAIVELADGSFLISGGAARNQLFHIPREGGPAGLPIAELDKPIFNLAFDGEGRLWATTGGGPLLQLDPTTGAVLQRTGEGLTMGLALDPVSGRLFVGSRDGVEIFDPETNFFQHYSRDLDLRVGSLAFDATGKLWATTWPDRSQLVRFTARARAEVMLTFDTPIDSLAFGLANSDLHDLLFVSHNSGELTMVDAVTLRHVTVAEGGTRGDVVATTSDGRVLISQSNQVDVLTPVRNPVVVATNPAHQTVVALPLGVISVTFDQDMYAGPVGDPASVIDPSNYALKESDGTIVGIRQVTYDRPSRTAYLFVEGMLPAVHELTIFDRIKGANGYPLAAPYVVTFTAVSDFSADVDIDFTGTRLDRGGQTIAYEVSITNTATYDLLLPLALILDPTHSLDGMPYDADARFDDGRWMLYLNENVPGGVRLQPGQSTIALTVRVLSPDDERADYLASVLAVPSTNLKPVFSGQPAGSVAAGQTYNSTIHATDPDGSGVAYLLYRGPEGMTVNALTGAITWATTSRSPATNEVIVYAFDTRGGWEKKTWTLTVTGGNRAPVFGPLPSTLQINEGETWKLPMQATDADGDALAYWVENLPPGAVFDPTTRSLIYAANFQAAGTYSGVTLFVSDGVNTVRHTLDILVAETDQAPILRGLPASRTLREGDSFILNVQGADEDGDPIEYSSTALPEGAALHRFTGRLEWTPGFHAAGHYDVPITVTAKGKSTTAILTLTVLNANAAPLFDPLDGWSVAEGQLLTIRTFAFDPDNPDYVLPVRKPDGTLTPPEPGPVSYTITGLPPGATFDAATATLRWVPDFDDVGTYTFTVTATDDGDGTGVRLTSSATATIRVRNFNRPPVIDPISNVSVNLGQVFTLPVSTSDPDGNAITLRALNESAGYDLPGFVQFVDNGDGTGLFTFNPESGYRGNYVLTLEAKDDGDGDGDSLRRTSTASFVVTVVSENDPPVLSPINNQVAVVGEAFSLPVFVRDIDQETLTYTLAGLPAGATLTPTGFYGRAVLDWTPTAGDVNTYFPTITVTDAGNGNPALVTSDLLTFRLIVRAGNATPTIAPIAQQTVDEGQPFAVDALGSDIDGDDLTWSVSGLPEGATINPATGALRWTPTYEQAGVYPVVVTASDGNRSGSTTFTLTVNNINRAPQIVDLAPQSGREGTELAFRMVGGDLDGDAVQFSVTGLPSGAKFDPLTGRFRWTPGFNQAGEYTIRFTLTDSAGLSDSTDVVVRIDNVNRAPTITSSHHQAILGQPLHFVVTGGDPDIEDVVRISAVGLPEGATLNPITGAVNWLPGPAQAGEYAVVFTASDGRLTTSRVVLLRADVDVELPRVTIELTPSFPVIPGRLVQVHVIADSLANLTGMTLSFNGSPLTLDSFGRAEVTAGSPGKYVFEATATDVDGLVGRTIKVLKVRDPIDTAAPVVSLSPVGVLTGVADVTGSVADVNLDYWTLAIAELGSDDFREIARGEGTINGVLASIDPQTLANGFYRLRLTAADIGGRTSTTETRLEVRTSAKPDAVRTTQTDLTVSLGGITWSLVRAYDSLMADSASHLGAGWWLDGRDVNIRTDAEPTGREDSGVFSPLRDGSRLYLTLPGGVRAGFTFRPVEVNIPGLPGSLAYYRPAWFADSGITFTLKSADALLVRGDDRYYDQSSGQPYNPANPFFSGADYELISPDGTRYRIDAREGICEIVTPAGRKLFLGDTGVTADTGESVRFVHDEQGRLAAVRAPSGQEIHYLYDAQGRLAEVVNRATGALVRYGYEADTGTLSVAARPTGGQAFMPQAVALTADLGGVAQFAGHPYSAQMPRGGTHTFAFTIRQDELDSTVSGSVLVRVVVQRDASLFTAATPIIPGLTPLARYIDRDQVVALFEINQAGTYLVEVRGATANDVGGYRLLVDVAGDINADGRVDGVDSGLLASALGTVTTDRTYRASADLDASGMVAGPDRQLLARNYGFTLSSGYGLPEYFDPPTGTVHTWTAPPGWTPPGAGNPPADPPSPFDPGSERRPEDLGGGGVPPLPTLPPRTLAPIEGATIDVSNSHFDIGPNEAGFAWATVGAVDVSNSVATLGEGPNTSSALRQAFFVPDGAKFLRFTIVSADLGSEDVLPPDAFEAALLDAHTLDPIVGIVGSTFTDALFNLQADGTITAAPGVTVTGLSEEPNIVGGQLRHVVQIDVSALPFGTLVALSLDLLGFGAADSSVVIDDVSFAFDTLRNPVAADDVAQTPEDAAINISVLTNDQDADSGLDPASVVIVETPAHGSVSVDTVTGKVRYTPSQHFSGEDTFSYRVRDLDGFLSNVATVFVTVAPVPDAPTLSVSTAQGKQDEPIPLNISPALVDTDSSESLSIEISGVPTGASLSAGTRLGLGRYRLTTAQLAGLTLTPPPGSDADFTLTVTAYATENATGERAGTPLELPVVIEPVGSSRVDLQACKLEYSIVSPK